MPRRVFVIDWTNRVFALKMPEFVGAAHSLELCGIALSKSCAQRISGIRTFFLNFDAIGTYFDTSPSMMYAPSSESSTGCSTG